MKVLVTVGTTSFDSLFAELDNCQIPKYMDIECQIANGIYIPKHFPWFRFSDDFKQKFSEADAIISHAGAGTVFDLLEQGKKSIVAANLERKDKHQEELANYVSTNQLALGITSLDQLNAKLFQLLDFSPANYQKRAFFRGSELALRVLQKYQLQ